MARELTFPVNYGSGHTGNVALQSHQSHHNGTISGSPSGGVKYHAMVSGTAVPSSAFMHSIAGQGVPTSMMPGTLHTPISPVGALTAQLNDLGHASWPYNHAVHGVHGGSPPHSPSENALAFSSGNGTYVGYPFGQPVAHRVQAHMKGARLSIGSSNDEEDVDIEPRSGKLVFQPSQSQSQPQTHTQNLAQQPSRPREQPPPFPEFPEIFETRTRTSGLTIVTRTTGPATNRPRNRPHRRRDLVTQGRLASRANR